MAKNSYRDSNDYNCNGKRHSNKDYLNCNLYEITTVTVQIATTVQENELVRVKTATKVKWQKK